MSSDLLLGIDGGGSTTAAWLADRQGRIVGRGRSGPSNIKSAGVPAALESLESAILLAFQDAGLEPSRLSSVCLGLAGADRREDKEVIKQWANRFELADRISLVNDGELVVAAGTPDGAGVGVISGTGSIAVGRARDGRIVRAGGWGHLFGDEGSAYGVAVAGLRLAARRADGRAKWDRRPFEDSFLSEESLISGLSRAIGVDDASAFVSVLYGPGWDRAKIASLAPTVVKAAETDVEVRDAILKVAGRELALAAAAVADSLAWNERVLPLAIAGSFVLGCSIVADALVDHLGKMTSFEISLARVADPVLGAIALAARSID